MQVRVYLFSNGPGVTYGAGVNACVPVSAYILDLFKFSEKYCVTSILGELYLKHKSNLSPQLSAVEQSGRGGDELS